YDRHDLARARRNERQAARHGLRGEIEDPFGGKRLGMRRFLTRTLDELQPLAEALGWSEALAPLRQMAAGAPTTAEQLRRSLRQALGGESLVPEEVLRGLAEARERQVAAEVEQIAAEIPRLGADGQKLQDMLARARDQVRRDPEAPIRFRPPVGSYVQAAYPDTTSEIVDLARRLIRIPSVTMAPPERQRLDGVQRAATFIHDYLQQAGLDVRSFSDGRFPALLASFPGQRSAPVMLCGHFDVVEPDPDDSQFEARLEGDYLWGRGAADMKTVVATYMVWMKDQHRHPGEGRAPVSLLLVGNEEIGEGEPSGSPHVLQALAQEGCAPGLLIAGERTGERGDELLGEICLENRGLLRFELVAHGPRGHSGVRAAHGDLSSRLFQARDDLQPFFERWLSLDGQDEWKSQARFPYIQVGEAGVFNVTAEEGLLGVEIRPIPPDDIRGMLNEIRSYSETHALELRMVAAEEGVACAPSNAYLQQLIEAVAEVGKAAPRLGRKLPATSARFAPGGQGIVWGQTGVGPHAPDERHFVPSILPYVRALDAFAARLQPVATTQAGA
ncbi:MAG: M20/M25/M40 family metallo-hydrolase, partial [Chloroflexi bacterium]|nr:M20/M25/M40 family metallo-hydrolase [Chloroflexota bacterium]